MKDILLIGCGGHAKSILDSIESSNIYNVKGFIDKPELFGKVFSGYKVIGSDLDLEKFYKDGIKNAFVCIGYLGNSNLRNNIYKNLKKIGFNLPNIIDKSSILAKNISLGEGNFIGKRAVINSDVKIHNMCIINTGAIVEHESIIESFSHISIGAILCGNVNIGQNVFIGAGSTVIHGVSIAQNTLVGANSTVLSHVLENKRVFGVVKGNL